MRNRFNEIKQHQGTPDIPYENIPLWSPGDDFPLSFAPEDIKKEKFRIIKSNFKRKSIDKDTYHTLMSTVRST